MAYFTEHNVVQVHLCYSMWQNSLPFSGCIIFHGLYVIHLSIHGYLGCFCFLDVVNSVAVNTAPFPFSEMGWMMPRLKSPGPQESPPLPGWVIFNSSLLSLSPALLICTVEMIAHPTGWSRGLDESVDITRTEQDLSASGSHPFIQQNVRCLPSWCLQLPLNLASSIYSEKWTEVGRGPWKWPIQMQVLRDAVSAVFVKAVILKEADKKLICFLSSPGIGSSKHCRGNSLAIQWLELCASIAGVTGSVSLIGELRFGGAAKKTPKTNKEQC